MGWFDWITEGNIKSSANLGACFSASAENPVQVGAITSLEGSATAARAGVERHLQEGDPVYCGDRVRTADNGRIEIGLVDEKRFTMGPNSEVNLNDLNVGKAQELGPFHEHNIIIGKPASANPQPMEPPTVMLGVRG